MKAIIDSNHLINVREIAKMLNVLHITNKNHIRRLRLNLDIWFPHDLKKKIHLTQQINICDTHFKHSAMDHFLKLFITGDEKWIFYNKINVKRSWPKYDEPVQNELKAEFHQIKSS